VKLAYPKARAIAVSSDGSKAYVTHFLTEEPGTDGHVSVVDLANKSVASVFTVAADLDTCETQNSGQGVLNLLSAIALMPDGAPADVAGQLWVGGTQENNVSKGCSSVTRASRTPRARPCSRSRSSPRFRRPASRATCTGPHSTTSRASAS
jgi:hypothetical protein